MKNSQLDDTESSYVFAQEAKQIISALATVARTLDMHAELDRLKHSVITLLSAAIGQDATSRSTVAPRHGAAQECIWWFVFCAKRTADQIGIDSIYDVTIVSQSESHPSIPPQSIPLPSIVPEPTAQPQEPPTQGTVIESFPASENLPVETQQSVRATGYDPKISRPPPKRPAPPPPRATSPAAAKHDDDDDEEDSSSDDELSEEEDKCAH